MGKRITKEKIPLFISLTSLILSIISVGFSVYVGNENLNLTRESSRLANFTPSIESSYSFSEIEVSNYRRNESFAFFVGFVDIDLMVLASQYSKLVVSLKLLNYSQNTHEWLDIEKQGSITYTNRIVYESFIERGFNPIKTQFIFDPMLVVKPNFISPDQLSFGYQLGNLTLEAKLIDLVTREIAITQEFNEGIYIEVKDIS